MGTKKRVIVDTDFMEYMARGCDGMDYYFNKLIADLEVEPVVHEFLYKKEMMGNPLVKKLVREKKLIVMEYRDFMTDINDPFYGKLFEDLYKFCNARPLDYGRFNFRTYQESDANLGEIHSVIMALYTGYPLFFSNDNGAKTLARTKINTSQYQLDVQNVMDVFENIAVQEDKSLTKKDFVNLTKGDKSRKERIRVIKDKWVG